MDFISSLKLSDALVSFLSTALLAGVDLAVLAWATAQLGTNASRIRMTFTGLAIVGKFALLAAGFATLAKQPWFLKPWGASGAIAPFAVFLLWQLQQLQRRAAAKIGS